MLQYAHTGMLTPIHAGNTYCQKVVPNLSGAMGKKATDTSFYLLP